MGQGTNFKPTNPTGIPWTVLGVLVIRIHALPCPGVTHAGL